MAERARREGLLALEEEAQGVDDPFIQKGLRLVVDGTDPELVKDILDLDVESMAGRHHEKRQRSSRRPAASRRRSASSARSCRSCTCSRTSYNPATLGPAISGAFIATLLRRRLGQPLLPAGGATS